MAAPMLTTFFSSFSRLTLSGGSGVRYVHTQGCPLLFNSTNQLWGAPMKKRKKMDPAILHQREQKRRKKIERQIKRLEKFGRQLKPVDEIIGDPKLKRESESRKRETTVLTFEESENRALLHKAWTRYRMSQHQTELVIISGAIKAQQKALTELRAESEELYQKAIQTDDNILSLVMKGPVDTPPIKDFDPCDGEYIDKTRTFDK